MANMDAREFVDTEFDVFSNNFGGMSAKEAAIKIAESYHAYRKGVDGDELIAALDNELNRRIDEGIECLSWTCATKFIKKQFGQKETDNVQS